VLDKPAVGLHMANVEKLIRVRHQMVDAGHSVVIEGTPGELPKEWRRWETGNALCAFSK